jgi:hypothetical protein
MWRYRDFPPINVLFVVENCKIWRRYPKMSDGDIFEALFENEATVKEAQIQRRGK